MVQRLSIPAAVLVAVGMLLAPGHAQENPVQVRHQESLVHGFLALRTLEGNNIADGDLTQLVNGDRVTTHSLFHFKDGSVHDHRAVVKVNEEGTEAAVTEVVYVTASARPSEP